MEKVVAYKTIDGRLFLDKDKATKHEIVEAVSINRKSTFKEKKGWVKQFISDNYDYDEFRGEKPEVSELNCYYEGDFAWDCDGEGNPIDKCIYSRDIRMGDDECVFCHSPEERK